MNAMVKIERAAPYDPAVGDAICALIADGLSVDAASQRLSVSASSVARWAQNVELFAEQYAQAKRLKLERMADGLAPLASEARGQVASEVQAIKLEVDTQKWLLSKLAPATYGDKLDVTSKGEALAAPSHMVDARVQSIVMQAAARMKAALDPEALSLLE